MNRQEEIRKMAYELYERSGMIPGREIENWLKAEKIVAARYAEGTKPAEAPAARSAAKKPAPKAKAAKADSPKGAPARAGTKKSVAPKKPKKS